MVIAYAGIIQGLGRLIGVDTSYSDSQFPTTESLVRNALIPIGASIVFAAAVVTWLGWWREILHYRVPVRRWVRWVPISMITVALIGLNYGHLADQSVSLVACLLLLGLFVGVGEELMFRGIGVHVFRRAGLTEGKVALYSSLVFGAVHISNAFGEGSQAIIQALVVSTSGYFFYLCLRVGGIILLPMLVHGLWDTSLLSNLVGDKPQVSLGIALVVLLQVALIIVLLIKRRTVETAPQALPS
ncbi:CPBP family intramembrane metalloprotease [Streptomyces sp. NBC_01387]|uniref:CPBP family intramembrane glutamic endopeptidase n=1 Tax=unclassified Streptomyces TaxID=2593676 RepID=UPI00202520D1|nr:MULTISPECIES: CPBP family intramembrane glutamic endopeptidase [unclassified Streptomyces]MCX4550425.1 CPBP family intramembrane metalloprotease [Streptomyces sp. NBC_01500]WSC21879.1 CPBP family intramembrane metalloprotease [Streptomyces sp. NBC_01766]WSV55834.1 CPBP family intramembrane metalloprotease [Streptomyces sp. NBC_01014]